MLRPYQGIRELRNFGWRRNFLGSDQEGIGVALLAYGCQAAVAGVDDGFIGQLHDLAANRVRDLIHRAAPEIRAANAAGEESVAGEEARRGNCDSAGIFRNVEAHAAWGVAGSMN